MQKVRTGIEILLGANSFVEHFLNLKTRWKAVQNKRVPVLCYILLLIVYFCLLSLIILQIFFPWAYLKFRLHIA